MTGVQTCALPIYHVRATVGDVLAEKDVRRALGLVAKKRMLRQLPWYKRPGMMIAMMRRQESAPDLAAEVAEELRSIGWPDNAGLLADRNNDDA